MAWLVCLSAGLFFLYEFFQLNLFDVINQPLRSEFQMDATALSWMSSAFLWGDILFLLPAGMLLDRYSTRWVILFSLLVCIIGTFGFALTNSFAWATFFHLLSGIGNAFCFLACVVLVTRWFPFRRQALVIGCLVTMAFLGGMIAHTPLAFLTDHYGWRNALLLDGGIGILILVWIGLFVKDKPQEESTLKDPSKPIRPRLLTPLLNLQTWLAGLYTACLNLPIMVICALWGASYLQVVHHVSTIAASNIVSLIFMGSILGCPLAGWLSDRGGRRKPLMICGAVATFVTLIPLCMGMMLSESMLSFLFFSLGLFTSTQVISYPLIAESNSAKNTGSATGIASIIIMGGGGVGQVLFGALMQHHAGAVTETYAVADYQLAMWMFPMAAIVSGLAMLLIRETYCERVIKGD
ncbi:MAG: MFS transporter [Legionellales bacterium]|nr:MFS transporter [Legionellales bacterium]